MLGMLSPLWHTVDALVCAAANCCRDAWSNTAVVRCWHLSCCASALDFADMLQICSRPVPPTAAPPSRLAALGTSLQLKAQFGVGYTLTLSRQPVGSSRDSSGENSSGDNSNGSSEGSPAGAGGQPDGAGGAAHVAAAGDSDTDAGVAALTAAVEQYVPGAQLLSVTGVCKGVQKPCCWACTMAVRGQVSEPVYSSTALPSCTQQSPTARAAGEAAYRLSKEAAPAFPPLLRQLEQDGARLGVGAYGLSETTLEEVFLRVSESAATPQGLTALAAAQRPSGSKQHTAMAGAGSAAGAAPAAGEGAGGDRSEFVVVSLPRSSYLKASWGHPWWEALAEWMQLCAGVLLAVIATQTSFAAS